MSINLSLSIRSEAKENDQKENDQESSCFEEGELL